eukprot:142412-Rhodomonas_salina.1
MSSMSESFMRCRHPRSALINRFPSCSGAIFCHDSAPANPLPGRQAQFPHRSTRQKAHHASECTVHSTRCIPHPTGIPMLGSDGRRGRTRR